MNGEELRQLTTELLDGREIGASKYAYLLTVHKMKRERMRPWMALRTIDTSKTWTSADDYTTLKALPTGFIKPFNARHVDGQGVKRTPVVLKAGDDILYPTPVPIGSHHMYKDVAGHVYFDFAQSKFGFTGSAEKTYTVYLHYIKKTTDPALDGSDLDNWTWDLSDEDSPILAYDIAIAQKGGIDYDEINARMVQYQGADARELWRGMVKWDDELQRASLGL